MMRDAKKDLEVCERATPGPWYREKTGANYKGFSTETVIADTCTFATGNKVYTDLEGKGGSFPSDDADFIALAREALPYWISRAMETERLLKKAFEALDALLVCFDNNVRPGFLIEIDDFLRGKYEPEKAEGWSEEAQHDD